MSLRMSLASALAFMIGASYVGAAESPVTVQRGVSHFAPINPDRVLYRQADTLVLKRAESTQADFDDLYVVNTSAYFALPEGLEAHGSVLHFEPARFAVMRLSPAGAAAVAERLHQEAHTCGVLVKLDGEPMVLEAADTPMPLIPVAEADPRVAALAALVNAENLRATIEELAAMHSRYHRSPTGGEVADFLARKYESLSQGRADVSISKVDHGYRSPQASLIVRIEGATRPDELIVLGSHLDSVNWQGNTLARSPGVDDNASGTATNLEIFRVLMESGKRLERTLEIHAYAAEEVGLVGSQDIANTYRRAGRRVVAMVQHDMTLYKAPGAPDKIWFIRENTHRDFNAQLATLVTHYTHMTSEVGSLPSGSSDHASWTRAGYAAAFPFENPSSHNPYIHTAHDTLDNANAFEQAAGFSSFGLAYALHFGGIYE